MFSIGDQEKTVVSAESLTDDNEYFLIIELEDETVFEFELSKTNKGKKINLLEPDPVSKAEITEAIDAVYYSIVVYKAGDLTSMHEIVNGNPKSTSPRTLGEGSYMQIDEEDGDIVLDFELRNCNFSTPFKANGITIAGHHKGFEKYVAPPK